MVALQSVTQNNQKPVVFDHSTTQNKLMTPKQLTHALICVYLSALSADRIGWGKPDVASWSAIGVQDGDGWGKPRV